MGLIHNLLVGIIHLVFVAMDILVIMVLVKVVYDRWQIEFLKHIANAIEPVINTVTTSAGKLAMTITGKSYPQKTLLVLLLFSMWIIRLIISSLI
ncbi:MAG: hypothetical protein KAS69_04895 [Planctomycetes bacterium]|nr:hypothetical protein [Planctomycetota bacterium]